MKNLILGAVFFAGLLAGCGGGGGGGGISITPSGSEYDTAEFRRNWALPAINPLYAYEQRWHGQEVTVGLIDVVRSPSPAHVEFLHQTLLVPNRAVEYHSSGSAAMVAGARNGLGGHGVAFSAQIVMYFNSIRTPNPQVRNREIYSSSTSAGGAFFPANTEEEARNNPNIPGFGRFYKDVLMPQKAVLTQSGGNRNKQTVAYHGAASIPILFPELKEHWIMVVALAQPADISDYSSYRLRDDSVKCGVGKDWCIAAPGGGFFNAKRNQHNGI